MCASSLFDGPDVTRDDEQRLDSQLSAVKHIMLDSQWRTIFELAELVYELTGNRCSETSISARIRDLRKKKHGSYCVERKRVAKGVWKYRVGSRFLPE